MPGKSTASSSSDKPVNYFDSKASSNWIKFIGTEMFTQKQWQWVIYVYILREMVLYSIEMRPLLISRPNKSISRTTPPPPHLFTRNSSNDQRSDAETFLYCHSLDLEKGRRRPRLNHPLWWRGWGTQKSNGGFPGIPVNIWRQTLRKETRAIRQKSRIHVPAAKPWAVLDVGPIK